MTGSLHSPPYEQFLLRLKRARLDAGLTQVEVAQALKLPQSVISKSESGERRVDIIELARLARLYRKPLEWFIEGVRI